MRQERKLYEYVYHSLISDIESGVFLQGQALPSQQKLCRQYNVGITTIRRVMKMLDNNGYIRTALGQPAIVICDVTPQMRINALAQSQNAIADAFHGLGLLLPALYTEAAKRYNREKLYLFKQIEASITDTMPAPELFEQANAFFTQLLRPLNNELMMDLEVDAENYLHVPYFAAPNTTNPMSLTALRLKTFMANAIEQIEGRQFDDFYSSLCHLYRDVAGKVDTYLSELSRQADALTPTDKDIRWFRIKDGSELYSRLAMTILRRIAGREFDEQQYLPSIPKLMEEYGVMKDTASRALALLNSLGVAQTIDKKGTVISMSSSESFKGSIDFQNPTIRQRLKRFIEALEIMALTTRGCAPAFSPASVDWTPDMEARLYSASNDRISPLSVQLLMHCAVHMAPCHSLQNIYRQLDDTLLWGYYLLSIDESYYPDPHVLKQATEQVVEALKAPSRAGLPDALDQAFRQIYRDVCTIISRFPETADLLSGDIALL